MADGTAVPFHTYHLGTCAAIDFDVQGLKHAECVLREIVAKLGLRDAALAALGHLDVRVVLSLTGQKKLYEDREFPDLDAIAQVMYPHIKFQ